MRTLIWKELRENRKWALVPGLVVLLLFLVDRPDEPMPDFTGTFWLCLTAALFGAALGFVQVFFDGHGDKRSLLLHRPLGRTRVFLAKALVGVGLYLLALGVPFAAMEYWMAGPGNMPAPYHWRTSLPWLADILTGVVYYFAGMLVAQRDVRWYGSRCLPLAAALGCSYLVWTLDEFWQALAAVGVVSAILALAAWGSFAAGGAYVAQPRLAELALGLTLLGGLLGLSALGKQRLGDWFDPGIEYEYTFDRQGRVLSQQFKPGVGVIGTATDLEGRPVPDFQGNPTEGAPLVFTETPVYWGYRNNGRFYVRCVNDSKPGRERWFYDHAAGRLLGYDVYYNQLLGSFGPEGFVPAGQSAAGRFPERFRYRSNPRRGIPVEFLTFAESVYAVDFSRRTVRQLFAAPAGETIAFTSRWTDTVDKTRTGLVVSTDRAFHFLTEGGTAVVTLPRHYDRDHYRTVFAGPLPEHGRYLIGYQSWVWWTTSVDPVEYTRQPGYVHQYDSAGRELSRQTVPPPAYAEASWSLAVGGLVTPVAEAAALVVGSQALRARERADPDSRKSVFLFYLEDIKYCIPGTSPDELAPAGMIPVYLGLMLLSATACTVGCLWLARRYAFSRTRRLGWALCGLLFGPAGLLLMLALLDWPARVQCPGCRKPRVVTREKCEHCGAAHAPSGADGTEIFEPAATTAPVCLAAC